MKKKGVEVQSSAAKLCTLWREKNAHCFLNMEKQKKLCISELENENGEIKTDLVDILDCVYSFYEKLFKKENTDEECMKMVLETLEKTVSRRQRGL